MRTLVDDIRRSRALEYLRDGKTIAEVAERVGFADPSALFRAYRRWTGTTPGADAPAARTPAERSPTG